MSDTSRTNILANTPVRFILQSGEPARIIIAALLQNGYSYKQVERMMTKELTILPEETQRIITMYHLKELDAVSKVLDEL